MCGRYAAFLPAEAMPAIFGTTKKLPNFPPSWNLAPTQQAPVVRRHPQTGERHLDLPTWGLVPHFTKDLASARKPVNARAETIATSGMFKSAFAQRRCIVPANAFYEWRAGADGKQPYAVARRDGEPMAFAGLWEGWRAPDGSVLRTFVIITTDANEMLRELHDRMPVVLEKPDWPLWLGETEGDPVSVLHPSANDVLRVWPVGRAVGNVKHNTPDLLQPAA